LGDGYRIAAPSRFGYPDSNLPSEPTPGNQAEAFTEVLDALDVEKVIVIATSAGGAPGIKMAIDYPSRMKGLVLLSSGMPTAQKDYEEINGIEQLLLLAQPSITCLLPLNRLLLYRPLHFPVHFRCGSACPG